MSPTITLLLAVIITAIIVLAGTYFYLTKLPSGITNGMYISTDTAASVAPLNATAAARGDWLYTRVWLVKDGTRHQMMGPAYKAAATPEWKVVSFDDFFAIREGPEVTV